MATERPRLTAERVIAVGGWHPRYARVLAIATDGDYGFALVDGNGDGAELEEEILIFAEGAWGGRSSSGAGPLDHLGSLHTWWPIEDVCFAYGRAPGRQAVSLCFAGQRHDIPISDHAIWAFAKAVTGRHGHDSPVLAR